MPVAGGSMINFLREVAKSDDGATMDSLDRSGKGAPPLNADEES